MLSKIDSAQYNQNFGWINISDKNVSKNLAKRMSEKDFEKLKNLIQYQKTNPVEVRLCSYDKSDVIRADIYGGLTTDYITDLKEGFFSRLFNKSPMKFIEKMVALSNKLNKNLIRRNKMNRLAEETQAYADQIK